METIISIFYKKLNKCQYFIQIHFIPSLLNIPFFLAPVRTDDNEFLSLNSGKCFYLYGKMKNFYVRKKKKNILRVEF